MRWRFACIASIADSARQLRRCGCLLGPAPESLALAVLTTKDQAYEDR
jgi:hypothetical protein